MKPLGLLTTAACAFVAAVNAASLPLIYPSFKNQTLLSRGANSQEYEKCHAAHPGILALKKYAFQLEWPNDDRDYISPPIKDYCLQLGFRHRAVLVGSVIGGQEKPSHLQDISFDFTGKVYEMLKPKGDIEVCEPEEERPWKSGRETVTYMGEIPYKITEEQIMATGMVSCSLPRHEFCSDHFRQEVIGKQRYEMGKWDCAKYATALFQKIKA
ncbi:hypothetical protein MMC13_000253 [Lambiella insularis]|nr:hypothetical protein [Lambiella insularis]